ncbi:MAG: hypothetical protein WCA16_03065 [Candidatus Sulfotelmatobacter sp.]
MRSILAESVRAVKVKVLATGEAKMKGFPESRQPGTDGRPAFPERATRRAAGCLFAAPRVYNPLKLFLTHD